MKKLLLALVVVFGLTSVATAQEKNKWIGGSLGYWSEKNGDNKRTNNYEILPEIGFVVADSWGVAVQLGYAHGEEFAYDDISSTNLLGKSNAFLINPYARYSFLKGDLGCLFVDMGVGYRNYKTKYTAPGLTGSVTYKGNALEAGFKPGVAINLSETLVLTGKYGFLGYTYDKVKNEETKESTKADSFGLALDMSAFELGLSVKF